MTQEHSSKLSFSIEESVWLNKGQEVEEIIAMSLEPEIVIEERDHHVYIKGGLSLIGEYQSADQAEVMNIDRDSLEEQVSFRSVGDIDVANDGLGKIKHFFPIDVTIPISRIQNLDDVYVQVDSFDYDLPEKSCIQLTADISISGMTNPQETNMKQEREEEIPLLEAVPTSFAFEAKKQPVLEETPLMNERVKDEKQEPKLFIEPKKEPPTQPISSQKNDEPLQEEHSLNDQKVAFQQLLSNEQDIEIKGENEKENTENREETPQIIEETAVDSAHVNEMEEENQLEEVQEEKEIVEMKINVAPLKKMTQEPALRDNENEEKHQLEVETTIDLALLKETIEPPVLEEKSERDEGVEEKQLPTYREENALYLTKMMSKGEERFTKWKMCIIQNNESLETIARRYDVTTNQLVGVNRLQKEQVEEGQILYIPITLESK